VRWDIDNYFIANFLPNLIAVM